jgi:hypothetical protein
MSLTVRRSSGVGAGAEIGSGHDRALMRYRECGIIVYLDGGAPICTK